MKAAGFDKVPETWPEAIEVAKALHRPDQDQFGFITASRRGGFVGWVFWGRLACYDGDWFDKQAERGWHPTFDNDKGFIALETLVELMKYRHPVTLSATDDECNTALADSTAMYAPIQWGTAVLNNPEFSQYPEEIATDLVPRGTTFEGAHRPLMGGLGQFVPPWSPDHPAAWEWIKWINSGDKTDPRIGEMMVNAGSQPSRISLLLKYGAERNFSKGPSKAFPTAITPRHADSRGQHSLVQMIGEEGADYVRPEGHRGRPEGDGQTRAPDHGRFRLLRLTDPRRSRPVGLVAERGRGPMGRFASVKGGAYLPDIVCGERRGRPWLISSRKLTRTFAKSATSSCGGPMAAMASRWPSQSYWL